MPSLRLSILLPALLALAACAAPALPPPAPFGDFALGHTVVVADSMRKGPLSRTVTPAEWERALGSAVQDRLGRYEGGRLFNLGISVDGYALAPPGIPVVAAPKSVLLLTVNIWDDAAGRKLNPDGKRLAVLEELSGETLIGSGITRTGAEQMAVLSERAAARIEDWIRENPAWVGLPPDPAK